MKASLRQIYAIARTAFQEALRRKLLYVFIFLLALELLFIGTNNGVFQMAKQSGETDFAEHLRNLFAIQVVNSWEFVTQIFAIFLGVTAISSELAARTLASVLTRPVSREIYLVGRFFGAVAFLWVFLAAGIAVALLVGLVFGTQFTATFVLGICGMFVLVALVCAASLSLNALFSPVAAAVLILFFYVTPRFFQNGFDHPNPVFRAVTYTLYYLTPAKMPASVIDESFKANPHLDYSIVSQVLAENVVYTVTVILLACLVFSRRRLTFR